MEGCSPRARSTAYTNGPRPRTHRTRAWARQSARAGQEGCGMWNVIRLCDEMRCDEMRCACGGRRGLQNSSAARGSAWAEMQGGGRGRGRGEHGWVCECRCWVLGGGASAGKMTRCGGTGIRNRRERGRGADGVRRAWGRFHARPSRSSSGSAGDAAACAATQSQRLATGSEIHALSLSLSLSRSESGWRSRPRPLSRSSGSWSVRACSRPGDDPEDDGGGGGGECGRGTSSGGRRAG